MEWISVKERSPEPNERILAYCPNMTEADIGPVSVQWGWTCKRKRSDISHWMPLPESPNERTDCEPDVEEYEEMTIEAAIKHCEEVSRRSPCTPCEREHMRLAAWLTELVSLRAQQEQGCEYCREIKECEFDFYVRLDKFKCGDCPMSDCVRNHKGANYCRHCGRKLDRGIVENAGNSEHITAPPESLTQCDFCTNPMKNLVGSVQGCDGNCQFEDGVPPNITNSGLAGPPDNWEAQLLRDLARQGVSYQDAQAALDIIRQLKQKEKEGKIHGECI